MKIKKIKTERVCCVCNETKPLSEFTGTHYSCKPCRAEVTKNIRHTSKKVHCDSVPYFDTFKLHIPTEDMSYYW